jgi:hypothetical protein
MAIERTVSGRTGTERAEKRSCASSFFGGSSEHCGGPAYTSAFVTTTWRLWWVPWLFCTTEVAWIYQSSPSKALAQWRIE